MTDSPLTTSFDPDTRVLHVGGSVDEMTGPALREAIAKHSAAYTERLAVDLTDVDFLPSLGVGILAVSMRNAEENDTAVELVAQEGTIAQQVLNICGLSYRKS